MFASHYPCKLPIWRLRLLHIYNLWIHLKKKTLQYILYGENVIVVHFLLLKFQKLSYVKVCNKLLS